MLKRSYLFPIVTTILVLVISIFGVLGASLFGFKWDTSIEKEVNE